MQNECEGSRHELPAGPPPDVATACPVCGRETPVTEGGDGSRYAIAPHQKVVGSP